MKKLRHASKRFEGSELPAILFAVLLVALAFGTYTKSAVFSSPEVKFTDASTNGLQIVPASCPSVPSNPDYPHDTCSQPPCADGTPAPSGDPAQCPAPAAPSASIGVSPNPCTIAAGAS